jgi:hypothetical protein
MIAMPNPTRWAAVCGDAAEVLPHWPDRSVDLVFFSPPYEAQRTYQAGMPKGKKFKLSQQGWVDWLAPIVVQCGRLSRGLVCVNMSSPVVDRKYTAAVEWLVADLTRVHGLVCGPAPYAWVKAAGTPGSGRQHYQRRDWEPVYAFALPDRMTGGPEGECLFWTDNTAFGAPPKYAPGGEFSHRRTDGTRVNQWGSGPNWMGGEKRPDGTTQQAGRKGHRILSRRRPYDVMGDSVYSPPAIANPGNVIGKDASDVLRIDVGGNHLGSKKSHKGEAPMPVGVAERFVCWFCPPDGIVLDPFCGTGTTLDAAVSHGRRGIGLDVRQSQVDITNERLEGVTPPLPFDAPAEPDLFGEVPA